MGGVDRADSKKAYYDPSLPRHRRWPLVLFELIINVLADNAQILWEKENNKVSQLSDFFSLSRYVDVISATTSFTNWSLEYMLN